MNTKRTFYHTARVLIKILLAIFVVFLVYKYCADSYLFGYRVFNEEPVANPPGKEIQVEIKPGMSLKDITAKLEKENVIRDSALFMFQVRLHRYENKLKSGTYTLTNSMTNKEIMKILTGIVEETLDEEIKR
ncbi:endolytic transglycosylase MltG [Anaerosacchariphilus polymeriproducens]|uniref:Aminodeoxychorismate lyase n=1 Tax=Anaerosacchariphilus polymeriproducens TaxID=1812858 RepID=A0A371AS98_9FIRM|nr:endolytic transglycosylase MltG [Anaerosacchariphilus polymeriproducens]RDU22448.1 hypothetical protein DWV06_14245 [Anaerosacchariphilus polymeriproducens]